MMFSLFKKFRSSLTIIIFYFYFLQHQINLAKCICVFTDIIKTGPNTSLFDCSQNDMGRNMSLKN